MLSCTTRLALVQNVDALQSYEKSRPESPEDSSDYDGAGGGVPRLRQHFKSFPFMFSKLESLVAFAPASQGTPCPLFPLNDNPPLPPFNYIMEGPRSF